MSRIGRKIIIIPSGVTLTVAEQNQVTVVGPKGQLVRTLPAVVQVTVADGTATVSVSNPTNGDQRALWGLWRKLLANMVEGVSAGFSKKLELNGVGYRVAVQGNKVVMSLGFSHPVEFLLPDGITGVAENNSLTISGIDKEQVGQIAATIRSLRKPEPYKGKGIKYSDEVIRRKAGKAAKAAG